MLFLHFAHRGEAQTFIKSLDMKRIHQKMDLFQGDHCFLLISGEGEQNTTECLTHALSLYSDQVDLIINLGIAGALPSLGEKCEVGEIFPIRTAYQAIDINLQFKSYSSQKMSSTIDCLSSSLRVLKDDFADKLGCFAHLVDGEVWAVGSVCKRLGLPFHSYKLVSDKAGAQTKCRDISDRALEFSDRLYSYFCKNILTSEFSDAQSTLEAFEEFELPQDFHATVAQKRKLRNLLGALASRQEKTPQEILGAANYTYIREHAIRPKEKTQLLIDALDEKLHPFHSQLKRDVSKLCSSLKGNGIDLKFRPHFEDSSVDVHLRLDYPAEIHQKLQLLNEFKWEKLEEKLNGL